MNELPGEGISQRKLNSLSCSCFYFDHSLNFSPRWRVLMSVHLSQGSVSFVLQPDTTEKCEELLRPAEKPDWTLVWELLALKDNLIVSVCVCVCLQLRADSVGLRGDAAGSWWDTEGKTCGDTEETESRRGGGGRGRWTRDFQKKWKKKRNRVQGGAAGQHERGAGHGICTWTDHVHTRTSLWKQRQWWHEPKCKTRVSWAKSVYLSAFIRRRTKIQQMTRIVKIHNVKP